MTRNFRVISTSVQCGRACVNQRGAVCETQALGFDFVASQMLRSGRYSLEREPRLLRTIPRGLVSQAHIIDLPPDDLLPRAVLPAPKNHPFGYSQTNGATDQAAGTGSGTGRYLNGAYAGSIKTTIEACSKACCLFNGGRTTARSRKRSELRIHFGFSAE